jgi:putative acetyltransferase
MVSLVAKLDEGIVGHIRFSQLSIKSPQGIIEACSLAPMAVRPDRQRLGIGHQLVQSGLKACQTQGFRIEVVLGHPDYYSRFGFNAELARPLPNRFGAGEAWMEGQVEYPPPIGAFG